MLREQ
jgi:hypothetical protein